MNDLNQAWSRVAHTLSWATGFLHSDRPMPTSQADYLRDPQQEALALANATIQYAARMARDVPPHTAALHALADARATTRWIPVRWRR